MLLEPNELQIAWLLLHGVARDTVSHLPHQILPLNA